MSGGGGLDKRLGPQMATANMSAKANNTTRATFRAPALHYQLSLHPFLSDRVPEPSRPALPPDQVSPYLALNHGSAAALCTHTSAL